MFWLDNSSGVTDMPEIPAKLSPVAQWFTEGGNGKAPAYPGAHWYNIVQAELLNVLAAAEVEPDKTKLDQLLTAINILIKNKTDEIDGYLEIEKLLSEIKDKGEAAQKTSRENIGIDGDIAFRNKDNTFTEDNTFNKSVELKGGMKLWGHIGLSSSGGVGSGSIDMYRSSDSGSTLQLSTSAVTGSKNIHYRFVMSHKDGMVVNVANADYVVWNALNLTPVRTVNNTGPDAKGNVNVQGENVDLSDYYTKTQVDALIANCASSIIGGVRSYGLFTTKSNNTSFSEGASVSGSALQFAGLYLDTEGDAAMHAARGTSPGGIWKVLGPVAGVNSLGGNAFMAIRTS
ncbi:hypothetical protein K2652_002285 [Salmonella enterica subsp. enterica serovar Agbeni]|nr:hypothetical protein [Salmonella enterica subsp. enterica serovar Agbeni]EHW4351818.1 hypothetical protein [Salmonella enterica subsp. enterica serovar Agbeni]